MPIVLIPKEMRDGETRVSAIPETVQRMCKQGFTVQIEAGAGIDSMIADEAYEKAGASIVKDVDAALSKADIVMLLNTPPEEKVAKLKAGSLLICHVWPFSSKGLCEKLIAQKVTVFAMDQIPRTTKAQYMDALSSQMNLSGYKSVLLAAEHLPKAIPLMMTAAGTINPAKIVIMGAGVAGLQAIGTAKRLGAAVEATDVRPEVKEQVQSLGAKFIEPPGAAVGEGGYAGEQSEDFLKKQQETVRKHLVAADVVITTAKIPGRKAPLLVTKDIVEEMRMGSVIVDLAAEEGGNCELTENGKIVKKHGVTIVGISNIPGTIPVDASAVYSKNLANVIKQLFPEGTDLALNFEDEINNGAIIIHDGACRSARVCEAHGFAVPAST